MGMLGWCNDGKHKDCRRTIRQVYTDPRTNKIIYTGQVITCGCVNENCKCYKMRMKPIETVDLLDNLDDSV